MKNELFNEYGVKARLFPALLCLPPFLLFKVFAIDPFVPPGLLNKLFVVIAADVSYSAILIYLLAQINRFVSKSLFEDKAKFPSTLMLLPSSRKMSAQLRQLIGQRIQRDFHMSLPTAADEEGNPADAKTRSREIASLIVNKVGRGKLLFQHNIEYGFVRNLVGGSLVALVVSIAAATVFAWVLPEHNAEVIARVFTFLYLLPVIFSRQIIRHFGEEYAEILFREYTGGTVRAS
jgi:hypothetical protein